MVAGVEKKGEEPNAGVNEGVEGVPKAGEDAGVPNIFAEREKRVYGKFREKKWEEGERMKRRNGCRNMREWDLVRGGGKSRIGVFSVL